MSKSNTSLCFRLFVIVFMLVTFKSYAVSKASYFFNDSIPNITLNGKVITSSKQPIPGATVTLKGQNRGQATDTAGRFTFANIHPHAILIISAIGYTTKSQSVNGRREIFIKLDTLIRDIPPVEVITTGYQEIPREQLTGSFSKTDKEIHDNRISTDIFSRTVGITPALLQNNPTNNQSSELIIRGLITIKANAKPLIVLDHFPYDGNTLNIHPEDVFSIIVLKDAAAATIWGAQAGNGVIVITTKKGKFNQVPGLSFNINTTIRQKPKLEKSNFYFNSSDYIDHEIYLFNKGEYNADLNNMTNWPAISPVVDLLSQQRSGKITESEATSKINAFRGNDLREALKRHFYQNPINQQFVVSATGGGENFHSYTSVGYDKNSGEAKGNTFDRLTINTSNTYKPSKKLAFTGTFNFAQTISKLNQAAANIPLNGSGGRAITPYLVLSNEHPLNKDLNPHFTDSVRKKGFLDWQLYPLKEIELYNNIIKLFETRFTLEANYTIVPGLVAEVMYGYQKTYIANREYKDPESYFIRSNINRFSDLKSASATYPFPKGGQLILKKAESTAYNIRTQLNFKINRGYHDVSAIGGMEVRETQTSSTQNSEYGYNANNGASQHVRNDVLYPLVPSGYETIPNMNLIDPGMIIRNRAYYLNTSYSFKEKYIATISGRIDQSNLLGTKANLRSTPLYAAGVRWVVTQEPFMKVPWLTQASVRYSVGFTGNKINSAAGRTTGNMLAAVPPLQPAYSAINELGNPLLSWEKVMIQNLGIDLLLWNTVTATVEVYQKSGSDLIGSKILTSGTGFSSYTFNFGNMRGHGADLVITKEAGKGRIKWSPRANISFATDKVTQYNETDKAVFIGKPLYSVFALRSAGLDPQNGNPRGYEGDTISTNYAKLIGVSKDKMEFFGSAIPQVFGGFTNTLSYKQFTFSAIITYKLKYYFIRPTIQYSALDKTGAMHSDYLRRWQHPGDELNTDVPSYSGEKDAVNRDAFHRSSSPMVQRGDHIRLQDLLFSYNFSKSPFNRSLFKNIQLQFNISNLGIIWRANKFGLDPDYFMSTIPSSVAFSFGIKLQV